jgi:hypothetical protein
LVELIGVVSSHCIELQNKVVSPETAPLSDAEQESGNEKSDMERLAVWMWICTLQISRITFEGHLFETKEERALLTKNLNAFLFPELTDAYRLNVSSGTQSFWCTTAKGATTIASIFTNIQRICMIETPYKDDFVQYSTKLFSSAIPFSGVMFRSDALRDIVSTSLINAITTLSRHNTTSHLPPMAVNVINVMLCDMISWQRNHANNGFMVSPSYDHIYLIFSFCLSLYVSVAEV